MIMPKNSAPIIMNKAETLAKTKIKKKTEYTVIQEIETMIAENTAIVEKK